MGIRLWGVDQAWTLFLDRDGVINRRILGGYVRNYDEFEFLEGVTDALRLAHHIFGRIVLVTNQQGVGKGLMSEGDLEELHQAMVTDIQIAGGRIDGIFAATELATAPNNRRKPSPLMAHEAKERFPEIQFEKSIMVGDTNSDLTFGKRLGMKTAWVRNDEKVNQIPDLVVSSLYDLIHPL
ncbi:MAG: D-glycero-alpha-D-manno-heptose-1,7-bisphosphate 7-phosphatase [Flavobacteriales bacterium]